MFIVCLLQFVKFNVKNNMNYLKWVVIGGLIVFVSCKTKKDLVSNVKENTIPVMETNKKSSLSGLWIDAETGHKVEKLVNRN